MYVYDPGYIDTSMVIMYVYTYIELLYHIISYCIILYVYYICTILIYII